MANYGAKQNTKVQNHGNRKILVAAITAVFALAVLLIVFLAAKNSIFFSAAQSKAENGEFLSAHALIEKSGGEEAEILSEYINLRLDINEKYPELLSCFDISVINKWSETALSLSDRADILGDELAPQAALLSQKLTQITICSTEYETIKYDILSLMDVFAEINRLHTKDADGKNTAFTVAEERAKISSWEQLNSKLSAYAYTIPGYESIYLLNYLIKEVQGEISDLNAAIDSVAASGYSETDRVRFSGTGQKRFPDISNSNNESVNLLEKENYEKFMSQEIFRVLVENLGEFYMP